MRQVGTERRRRAGALGWARVGVTGGVAVERCVDGGEEEEEGREVLIARTFAVREGLGDGEEVVGG